MDTCFLSMLAIGQVMVYQILRAEKPITLWPLLTTIRGTKAIFRTRLSLKLHRLAPTPSLLPVNFSTHKVAEGLWTWHPRPSVSGRQYQTRPGWLLHQMRKERETGQSTIQSGLITIDHQDRVLYPLPGRNTLSRSWEYSDSNQGNGRTKWLHLPSRNHKSEPR